MVMVMVMVITMVKFQIMYGFDYNDIYRHLKRVNEHVSHTST